MKDLVMKVLALQFLFFGLGTLHAMGEVTDSLAADIVKTNWDGGLDVTFKGEKDTVSVVLSKKEDMFSNVYDLNGRMICKAVFWDVVRKELPSGVYFVNRRKVVIKKK